MVYYSRIIGKPIIDNKHRKVGIVKDFCFSDGDRYATILGIVCDVNGILKVIKWCYVSELGDKPEDPFPIGIYLNRELGEIKFSEITTPLLRDILDRQIIDVSGARIVRVNDILLGKIGKRFTIVGVDVSTKGMLRRVGISKFFNRLHEHIITWKDVAPLSSELKILQLKTKKERLNELHPAELADMIRDLSLEDKVMVFNTLTEDKAAETLIRAQPDIQRTFFKSLSMKKIANLLEQMPSDEAVALLNMMPAVSNVKVLRMMKPGIAARIQKVLSYGKRTAASLMSTDFLTIPISLTVEQAIQFVHDKLTKHRQIYYLYVTDENGVLKGAISLRKLLVSGNSVSIAGIMRKDMITININTGIDDVFNLMGKYSLVALPVIDKEKKIVGVIRANQIFDTMLPDRIRKQRLPRIQKRIKHNGHNSKP